jgi:hypothetical protein
MSQNQRHGQEGGNDRLRRDCRPPLPDAFTIVKLTNAKYAGKEEAKPEATK